MKGCNQFCAYCVVPYTRGREVSKPPDEVLAEAAMLAAAGAREVCLLGQNVNRYGLDLSGLPTFAELLRLVHGIEGIERIRFVTSHPADCTDELLRCFRDLERLTPYFHLPIQSGSNRILQRMNRWYTREHYLDRVRLLRSLNPDVHISTDIIVGFPGESEEDHELTLDMIRQVGWGSAYSFKYSPRPGTAAAKLPDDVPAAVKQERLEKVQSLLYDSRRAGMARHVGRVESVLVEGASVRSGGRGAAPQLTGRTGTNYVVNFSGGPSVQELAGRMVPVRIIGANRHSLVGELAPREA
jgi:tRNA-2-methylthio-N6-dimethylallyladenosine synthase